MAGINQLVLYHQRRRQKMPEVDRPDYVMYEMVLKEVKKTKNPRPNSATILNMEDIQMNLQV